MLDRRCESVEQALEGIKDGMRIMVSGFGEAGRPNMLIKALIDSGVKDIELVSNNAGAGYEGLAMLFRHKMVRKLYCSFPRGSMGEDVKKWVLEGGLEIEVMPQGTLAERIRAAGCGIPAFYTPTAYGTKLAEGKETRMFDGVGHVMETALKADVALVKAHKADRWGNLTYLNLARNFSPLMAMAATTTIVEADEIVELGELEPNTIVTPGICVDRLVTSRRIAENEWGNAA